MADEDPSGLVGVQFVHQRIEHLDLRDEVDVLVLAGRIAEVREVDTDAFDAGLRVPLDELVEERRVTAEAMDHEHLRFLFASGGVDPVMEVVIAILVVLTVGEGGSCLELQLHEFCFCHCVSTFPINFFTILSYDSIIHFSGFDYKC